MIVVCPSCQSRFKFDESKLGDARRRGPVLEVRRAIEIENPMLGASTLPPNELPPSPKVPEILQTRKTPVQSGPPAVDAGATLGGADAHRMGLIQLPKDKRFSLAVIQGGATGQIFPISKTRTIVGRSGCDVNLDDPEASRQHAALEIVGDVAILRDLGSTNGTWIELDRVEQHELSNQQEFRIGSHVLMFIVTDVD
jgi:predicted Zn finger-like uncharacterized protein